MTKNCYLCRSTRPGAAWWEGAERYTVGDALLFAVPLTSCGQGRGVRFFRCEGVPSRLVRLHSGTTGPCPHRACWYLLSSVCLSFFVCDAVVLLISPPQIDAVVPSLLVLPPGTDLHEHAMVKEGRLVLQGVCVCVHAPRPRPPVVGRPVRGRRRRPQVGMPGDKEGRSFGWRDTPIFPTEDRPLALVSLYLARKRT